MIHFLGAFTKVNFFIKKLQKMFPQHTMYNHEKKLKSMFIIAALHQDREDSMLAFQEHTQLLLEETEQ